MVLKENNITKHITAIKHKDSVSIEMEVTRTSIWKSKVQEQDF